MAVSFSTSAFRENGPCGKVPYMEGSHRGLVRRVANSLYGQNRIEGSNPSPSAKSESRKLFAGAPHGRRFCEAKWRDSKAGVMKCGFRSISSRGGVEQKSSRI